MIKIMDFSSISRDEIFDGVNQKNTIGGVGLNGIGQIGEILPSGGKIQQNKIEMLSEKRRNGVGKAILENQ